MLNDAKTQNLNFGSASFSSELDSAKVLKIKLDTCDINMIALFIFNTVLKTQKNKVQIY